MNRLHTAKSRRGCCIWSFVVLNHAFEQGHVAAVDHHVFFQLCCIAACASIDFANIMSPDVPRSRRWTTKILLAGFMLFT